MKKYISIILASVFLFACSPPDPGISSDIQVLNPGETYNTHVGKINSNFANLNTDKLEDAPSDGSQYARQDGAWSVITAGGGAVDSVFGRTGAVIAESGDYASFYLALATCTTSGQIPKWDGSAWTCATDETGSGSLPPGNAANDILQWDGSAWAVQGFINGMIDDTAGDGDTTSMLSANEINIRVAAVNDVPAGGTTGQVLGKASDTDNDVAWIDQTGSGGGVTSIIAGTNITIDPTSGLGDVTINAATDSVGGYVPVPTNSDSSCTEGQYAIDRPNNFIYWCYAPDSWDRVPSTFDQWDNPSTVYYNLAISPTPSNGRITEPADNSNINCGTGGNDCDHDYEDGTDVVLHSIPESGYALDSWSGTGLTDNGDGTATVHVDQDISDVTATFTASTTYFFSEDFGTGYSWTEVDNGGTVDENYTTAPAPIDGAASLFIEASGGDMAKATSPAFVSGDDSWFFFNININSASTHTHAVRVYLKDGADSNLFLFDISDSYLNLTALDGSKEGTITTTGSIFMWLHFVNSNGSTSAVDIYIGTDGTRPGTPWYTNSALTSSSTATSFVTYCAYDTAGIFDKFRGSNSEIGSNPQ